VKRSGCLENAEHGSGSWNVGVIAPPIDDERKRGVLLFRFVSALLIRSRELSEG